MSFITETLLKSSTRTKITTFVLICAACIVGGLYATAALPLVGVDLCSETAQNNALFRLGNIFKKCQSTSTRALVLKDIQEAYTDLFDHQFGSNTPSFNGGEMYIRAGETELGSFDLNMEPDFTDGSVNTNTTQPIQIGIRNGDLLLDQHVTFLADQKVYTICVPRMNDGDSFYFDRYGTPYYDSALSQPALATPCATFLEKGLDFNVSQAGLSGVYEDNFDYYAIVRGNFWQDPIWEFGCLHQNAFLPDCISPESYSLAFGAAPLVIAPHPSQTAIAPVSTPADVLTVWDENENVKNICVPEVFLPSEPLDSEALYVAKNGDTYKDAFFRSPAFLGCPDVLARSAKPTKVFSVSTTNLPEFGAIALNRGSIADARLLGWLRYDEGWIAGDLPETATALQGGAPLIVALQNLADSKTIEWQQQTISINTNTGTYTFCLPTQTLTPGPKAFYVDQAGQAYSDVLLQQPVSCD